MITSYIEIAIFPSVKKINRDGSDKRAFSKMLPVDSMEIYSFLWCFDRRVHSTVMQVRHALTWHLPVYLLMISQFFFTCCMIRKAPGVKHRQRLLPAWLYGPAELASKKKPAITPSTNVSTVLRADYLPLAFPHLQPRRLCPKHRSTPFNISLTTQPQSHATTNYLFHHVINNLSSNF